MPPPSHPKTPSILNSGPLLGALLFLLPFADTGEAAQPGFRRYTVEEGLSQGTITVIMQDHHGFMWFGTQDGLNRFDGHRFVVYRRRYDDSTTLSDNWITGLAEAPDRSLWVMTKGGLDRFDRASGAFARIRPAGEGESLGPPWVTAMSWLRAPTGNSVLVVMPGVRTLDPSGTLIPEITERGLARRARAVIADGSNRLWLAGGDTVSVLAGAGGLDLRHFPLGQGAGVSSAVWGTGPDAGIWVAGTGGLRFLDTASGSVTLELASGRGPLAVDGTGGVWVGAAGEGVVRVRGRGTRRAVSLFRHDAADPASLSDDGVMTLFADASGGIWVGTFNGLNRFDLEAPAFTLYRHVPGEPGSLAHDFVLPIMEDVRGDLWFGTFGGGISILGRRGGGRPHFMPMRSSPGAHRPLCSNNVRSLLQDRAGRVWIGTSGGLVCYDPVAGSSACVDSVAVFPPRLLWADAILETRGGRLLAGATGMGLVRVVGGGRREDRITAVPFSDLDAAGKRRPGEVRAIVEDRTGVIWVATEAGLVRVDSMNGLARRFTHDPGDTTTLSSDAVWSLLEDPLRPGILWVGTAHGLNRFDTRAGSARRYLEQPGFPNANVYGILSDAEGRLWLSTNHGLTCFDDSLPQGRKFRNYDANDGLQGNEFNRHSYAKLRSGELVFGGTHGASRFDPRTFGGTRRPPRVVITGFSRMGRAERFDRDIAEVELIEIRHDDRAVAFEYAGIEYAHPRGVRYATMLEGLDRAWVDAGDRRFATYTNLAPGEYVFRVTAASRDGLLDPAGASVRLVVSPPLWGTWWFRLGVLASMTAGLVVAHRRRVRALRREQKAQREFSLRLMESQEAERKRIAGELHDGLGQDLLVVKNRALVGLRDPGLSAEARRQLDEIAAVTAEALDNVRTIAHGLHPYQLDHLGLSKAVVALGARLSRDGPLRFDVEVDRVDEAVGRNQAIHLYRIVQEATNNILKHAAASKAGIALRLDGTGILLTVSDNGAGMRGGGAGVEGGLGLAGIRERVAILGGTLHITSRPGGGTVLTIRVPGERGPG